MVVAPPPPSDNFLKDDTELNKLYITGKRIYRRLQLILDVDKKQNILISRLNEQFL